jgi:hypothetical protein
MANNAKGGEKLRERMIEKHGSEEAWKDYMRTIASKGGRNGTGHEYGHGKVDPVENGRKGGLAPRRRKSEVGV